MAKVMISLPDELLERLDSRARTRGTTRSGLIRELAGRELSEDRQQRRTLAGEILGKPGHYGGKSVAAVRELRSSR